jgi:hypothetical protein
MAYRSLPCTAVDKYCQQIAMRELVQCDGSAMLRNDHTETVQKQPTALVLGQTTEWTTG